MASDETEQLLDEIGQLLARDTEYPLDRTLLYALVDFNWVEPSIYKDRGNHILYRSPDLRDLGDALLDLWEAQTSHPRWEFIEYYITDGKFEVIYTYPDEIDPEEEPMDRRTRIVRRYFGDKPIIYPQPEDEEDGWPVYDE